MHIAICDIDVAHRFHLERLLKRVSGNMPDIPETLYIDTYGTIEALRLGSYHDLIFLHVENAQQIANELFMENPTCSIVLFKDADSDNASYMYYHAGLSSPISADTLEQVIAIAASLKKPHEKTVEVRAAAESLYIKEDAIIYAQKCNCGTEIMLSDYQTIQSLSTFDAFCNSISSTDSFLLIDSHTYINLNHIERTTANSIIMSNHKKIPIRLFSRKEIFHIIDNYRRLYYK